MRNKLLTALMVLLVLTVLNLAVVAVWQWRRAGERERYIAQLEAEKLARTETPPPSAQPSAVEEILRAVGQGNVGQLRTLLDAHPELVSANTHNRFGNTPLHFAAYNNQEEVAAELIKRGANVNAVNRNGNTPLHDAISAGNQFIVRLLLDHKADVHLKTTAKQDPAAYASQMNQDEIVEMIRKYEQTAGVK